MLSSLAFTTTGSRDRRIMRPQRPGPNARVSDARLLRRFNNGAKSMEVMGADPVKLKEAIKDFIKRVRVEGTKAEAAAAAT